MDCDRCGRGIEGGALMSVGARRFRSVCRTCWSVETRSSNARLISALNRMTRGAEDEVEGIEPRGERRRAIQERRVDPERPRWHS